MTSPKRYGGLTYQDAGVEIDAGKRLVEQITPLAAATHRSGVLAGLGGYGGLFELPSGYRQPVLVSGTDGVGTKLKLAIELGHHAGIGIDLVAMCANDIVVTGAEPLFFLDYYASGRLDLDIAGAVVAGIAEGCRLTGCALIGGETAEMPGLYAAGDYDLAGFCVGVVEKEALMSAARVKPGDVLIGVAASGPHANGYSLIRRILALGSTDPTLPLADLIDTDPVDTGPTDAAPAGGRSGQDRGNPSLGEVLLTPTRLYVKPVLGAIARFDIHALAHITGGGLTENLPRVLPAGVKARVDLATWSLSPLFRWLQVQGDVARAEMLRTFNCGIGLVVCVPEAQAAAVCEHFHDAGDQAWIIGGIVPGAGPAVVEYVGTDAAGWETLP
jgi:phosphoribosylformylglycinamidine cyclo-ligase